MHRATKAVNRLVPHILYYMETGGVGGAERYLIALIQNVHKVAFEATVCVPNLPGNAEIFQWCDRCGVELVLLGSRRSTTWQGRFLGAMRIFRRQHPTLIHFVNIGPAANVEAILGAIVLRVPFLITEHLIPDAPAGGWKYRVYRQFVSAQAYQVLTVSQEGARRLAEYHGVPSSKIKVIYNGVDCTRFRPRPEVREAYRHTLGIGLDEIVFIQVGSLVGHKNPLQAVEAFAKLPDSVKRRSRLIIVGDGPLRVSLQERIAALRAGEKIFLLGYRHDVSELLCASDVLLHTSCEESFGLAVLEAMASGLPVIAYRVGGLRELVSYNSGFLVAPGNIDEMVQCMIRLANDFELRSRMGKQARRRAKLGFSLGRMVQEIHNTYNAIANAYVKSVLENSFVDNAGK